MNTPVTKTFLPPIEAYQAQVKRAFDNQWLTNRGELVLELEGKLKNYLETDNIIINIIMDYSTTNRLKTIG